MHFIFLFLFVFPFLFSFRLALFVALRTVPGCACFGTIAVLVFSVSCCVGILDFFGISAFTLAMSSPLSSCASILIIRGVCCGALKRGCSISGGVLFRFLRCSRWCHGCRRDMLLLFCGRRSRCDPIILRGKLFPSSVCGTCSGLSVIYLWKLFRAVILPM